MDVIFESQYTNHSHTNILCVLECLMREKNVDTENSARATTDFAAQIQNLTAPNITFASCISVCRFQFISAPYMSETKTVLKLECIDLPRNVQP